MNANLLTVPETAAPCDDCNRRKTVLYCRTANGGMDAIGLQLKRLCSYAQQNGCTACGVAWDCNAGGGVPSRPGLQKLLDDVRSGCVERIIVWDTARLARNIINFRKPEQLFDDCATELITVADGGYDSANITAAAFRVALEEVYHRDRSLTAKAGWVTRRNNIFNTAANS